jgi:hypothetical protein
MANGPAKVEIENRTTQRWLLEHPDGVIVIGDERDRVVQGERDPFYQPNPVVTLTRQQLERMPEHSRKMLDKLVARGDFQRRELAA